MAAASKFLLISLLFCFLTVPCVSSLQFNLPKIGPEHANKYINITGDAYITNQGIQITPNERNTALNGRSGRATYFQPLHLWDKSSGMLANFSTNFSFLIYSDNSTFHADGIAFFLAPVGSNIPSGQGGYLALTNNTSTANPSLGDVWDPVVAVEFDTFGNVWDPPGQHVGIDINSVQSVKNVSWMNNITQQVENRAWITYDSTAKNLTVVFTGFWNDQTLTDSLNYVVDLSEYLPEWVTFGFSGATGAWFELNSVISWSFYSSTVTSNQYTISPAPSVPDFQGTISPSVPDSQGGTTGTKKKRETGMTIGIVGGLSAFISLLVLLGYATRKQRKMGDKLAELQLNMTMDNEFEMGSGARKFSFSDLAVATKYFSEEEKLGEGGFGSVYRGFSRDLNSYIAVKRVSRSSKQGLKEYASEVKIISQLRHRNLVQLIGWCHEKGELLLVYEFMPNGSLDSHLFRKRSLLSWEARYKIAQGLASALLYLHEEWEQCVVHRDIKSSNIMLDSSFNAKLGDFGLARLVDHEKGSQTTILAGTMGYMAPECAITGKASKESDVFSFGIVVLEIACGRNSVDLSAKEDQTILLQWIWELYGMGMLLEGADPRLGADFDEQQMEQLMIVGLWCAHPDSASRPSIRQAIHVLNSEARLPNLPPKMPLPTYAAPAYSMYSEILHTHNVDVDDDSIALNSSNYSSNTGSSGLTSSSLSAFSSASLPRT